MWRVGALVCTAGSGNDGRSGTTVPGQIHGRNSRVQHGTTTADVQILGPVLALVLLQLVGRGRRDSSGTVVVLLLLLLLVQDIYVRMRVLLLLLLWRSGRNRCGHLALRPGTVGRWGWRSGTRLAAGNRTAIETALTEGHGTDRSDPMMKRSRRGGGDGGTNALSTDEATVLVLLPFLHQMTLVKLLLLLLLLHHFQFRLLLLVLNPPAHTLFRLGHCGDRCELLHHSVVPKRPLDGEGCVARLNATVLALQQFDLLVQQILRQLIPSINRSTRNHLRSASSN